MKLSELAAEHRLDTELLREVVADDLGIALPKGMDTALKPAEVKRILACDGLETADGKPFTPIIAKEFEEKHKKKVATKKGMETRKKKAEEEAEAARTVEVARLVEEKRKHEEALARRRAEEDAAAEAAAETERRRAEAVAQLAAQADSERVAAEQELLRREAEAKRMVDAFAAMRAGSEAAAPETGAAEAAPAAEARASAAESVAAPAVPVAPAEPVKPLVIKPLAAPKAPVEPPPLPLPVAKVKGLGSKLASLAKETHDKADHSIKAVPKPVEPAVKADAPPLSDEDRRRLIQQNIARNLQMAKKVAEAKSQARKPGFRTIDRTKSPGARGPGGPGRGPGGPNRGGPGRGPGGPSRGAKRDNKDHRTEQNAADEAAGKTRRFRSTLSEEDLSGVTTFSIAVPCTVREFSEASGVKASVIIAKLFMAGMMANINSVLGKDEVELLSAEFKKTVTVTEATDADEAVEEAAEAVEDKDEDLAPRPPVVTIMGHVDHGKTSLLDAIKKTQVAAGEAGGITQHVGAYTVQTPAGLDVTFIDTPGHQAFTEMRARGAKVTDVAVIVVAADDGVMPQTVEAIQHAKAANVAIVVALNKCDKADATKANQEKILRQLAENGLQAEEWGGDVGVIRTSATTGAGLDELLERLALEAEALELKANHFAKASGAVLEAKLREGQGVVATLLVQRGSLAIGDVVLAGPAYGKVRSLVNWQGERSELAGPSTAVEVIGLDELPRAGDVFAVCDDLRQAAEAAEARRDKLREKALTARQKTVTTATVFGDLAAAKRKEVKVVVKADAAGSLEVLQKTIADLGTDEVRAAIIHSGIGAINASDVQLADASQAVVIGFHVIADPKARALADSNGVDIRSYTIIYEMLDELKQAMSGQLEPESRETVIGHAEVRQTFTITRVGVVAGLYITDGYSRRDAWMRITRDGKINHVGKVGSLRRFKEDVKEVKADYECGLTVEGFQDIKVGDVMEFYLKERVTRSL